MGVLSVCDASVLMMLYSDRRQGHEGHVHASGHVNVHVRVAGARALAPEAGPASLYCRASRMAH